MGDPNEKSWIRDRIEGPEKNISFTKNGKKEILNKIIQEIYECLNSDNLPKSGGGWNGEGCEQCSYKKKLFNIFKSHTQK